MIPLTPEQKDAVSTEGHLLLTACPGSGKTRVILAKLLELSDRVAGTPHFISCITYTNAAVDEIEYRLRKFGGQSSVEKCDVATIHSFCLQNILKPYHWLIPEVPPNFKVLTRTSADFTRIVEAAENAISRRLGPRTLDDYEGLRLGMDGQPAGRGYSQGSITIESAQHYWHFCRANGYLDFSMILYYAWRILNDYPFVSVGIGSRYSWFLVDEFQDTSDIQLDIFRLIQNNRRTSFFFVGDENQSILGFAGARPDLAREFAGNIGADLDKQLSANFRSGPRIIDVAETIISTNPRMHAEGHAAGFLAAPTYVHANRPIEAITDHFIPTILNGGFSLGKTAILAPWWTHLIPIARELRERDIPVYGPGARPYRRSRLFASLAEQLGACAEADDLLGLPGVEKSVFQLIRRTMGLTRFDLFSYTGRKTALSLIYTAKEIAARTDSGIEWLNACCNQIADILVDEEWITLDVKNMLGLSVDLMISDMRGQNVDVENLLVSDLGLFANPENAIKLITLHNSKGREFDAVAMICMNEGSIPHFTARTEASFSEARRLFYVGITRARKHLLIASHADHRNPPTRFIREAGLV